jgi:oligopeptide/dipeptide ABC transporter ATP-binding protein
VNALLLGRFAHPTEDHTMPLLEIKDLRTWFFSDGRVLKAVDGVSLAIEEGETVALVGESGCGKSVTALSILGLVPSPPGRIVGGEILLESRDLLRLDHRALRDVRGNRIGMIFQEPMTSLNPVFTVGNQIVEAIEEHRPVGRKAARGRAAELLDLVGLPDPRRLLGEYPHRLSGGMRQRVMIAMALACEPKLLIADEPTTALDVTTQAQILDLLGTLQQRLGMAMLIITHDLGVVARTARRVAVMYAGRKVEEASVADLLARPRHPYTQGLLASLPDPERELDSKPGRLKEIPGMVPPLHDLPPGCAFAPRCPLACDACRSAPIELRAVDARSVACIRAELTA